MELSWTVHPLKKDPKKSVFLIFFIILICLLTYLTFNSLIFTITAFILLIISMRQFFIRTHYIVDAEGVRIHSLGGQTKRSWNYFKSFYEDKNGVLLSPFKDKSYLESFRGVYLIFPDKDKSPALLEAISKHKNTNEVISNIESEASNGVGCRENLRPQILDFIKQSIYSN